MNKIIIQCESVLLYVEAKPKTSIQVQDEQKKGEVRTRNF